MGIAIASKSIKDGDKIAIQGKKPMGIAIQGKIVYVPPPMLASFDNEIVRLRKLIQRLVDALEVADIASIYNKLIQEARISSENGLRFR